MERKDYTLTSRSDCGRFVLGRIALLLYRCPHTDANSVCRVIGHTRWSFWPQREATTSSTINGRQRTRSHRHSRGIQPSTSESNRRSHIGRCRLLKHSPETKEAEFFNTAPPTFRLDYYFVSEEIVSPSFHVTDPFDPFVLRPRRSSSD